ncbi:MAG: hypothetical protein LBL58_19600 [Tannerellaceae bacterium]|jgi:hypothetical protein|nr:hypothetical protein [Tannerellaceae bacterium]
MLDSDRSPIFDLFAYITVDKNIQAVEEYHRFLSALGDRLTKPQKGFNLHHIVPRVFFNNNQIVTNIQRDDSRNLILLTPYEHFKAHVLLVAMFPHHHGLNSYVARVFKFFGNTVNDPDFEFIFTKVYNRSCQEIGKKFSQAVKQRWNTPEFREQYIQTGKDKWANPEYREKMSGANSWFHSRKPKKGIKTPEETRRKQSQTRIEKGLSKGENNPRFGKHWDEEHRKEMSERQKGEKSHRWEVLHTQKARHIMSLAQSEKQRQRRQEKETAVMAETVGFLF